MDPVVHLHNHSAYSALDSIQKLDAMVDAAVADGQRALAVTDHGTLAAAWQFADVAKKKDVKPILGEELYLALGSRFERNAVQTVGTETDPDGKEKRYQHLTALAASSEGWRNLVKITNEAQDYFWYKPRTDFDHLAEHAGGIVFGSGCLGGPVAGEILAGRPEVAKENLAKLVDMADDGHVFVEVMDHGIPDERVVIPGLVELARYFELPIVATNDAHYTCEDDADAHEAWLAVGVKKLLSDKTTAQGGKRFAFNGSGYHLRSTAEMESVFRGWAGCEDAVRNTARIADLIASDVLPERRMRLPKFPLPEGYETSAQYLYDLVREGARKRYGVPFPEPVKRALRFEFDTISGAGMDDYFLIVYDLAQACRRAGVYLGLGRGSVGGSVLAYCLDLHAVEPLANGLIFERFLNPDRVGMPDIDTDFETDSWEFVLGYLMNKYGAANVARLGSVTIARSRRAIKDAARVMERNDLGNKLAKLVPIAGGGKPMTFAEMEEAGAESRAFWEMAGAGTDEPTADQAKAAQIVALARRAENVVVGAGIHACGIVVSDQPLDELGIPLRHERHTGTGPKRGQTKYAGGHPIRVTEWDGHDIEDVGLLKLDRLSLRNLDIIHIAVDLIEQTTGEVVDINEIDYDMDNPRNRRTADLLAAEHTAGVFQLDSAGMTKLCGQVRPQSLDDMSALVALYRPGPMGAGMHEHYALRAHGQEPVSYDYLTHDPREAEIIASVLGDSYGLIIYQEQLMQLAGVVAGYTAGQRDLLRKGVSKKKKEILDELHPIFIEGGLANGFSRRTLDTLWTTFQSSASYLFNKAHSAAYGHLGWVTAYLKANWPAAYGAALLAKTDKDDKRQIVLSSLRSEGISVLGPDINDGQVATSVVSDTEIRLGLGEIAGVKSNAIDIVAERERGGPFTSLADVVNRVHIQDSDGQLKKMPITIMEALIESGACDAFGPRWGQYTILRAVRDVPDLDVPDMEWGAIERSTRERLRLGVTVSEHPLKVLAPQIRSWRGSGGNRPVAIQSLTSEDSGQWATTIGVIASWAEKSYRGGRMANFTLEGTKAILPCVIWDRSLQALKSAGLVPTIGDVVAVTGRISARTVVVNLRDDDADSSDLDTTDGDEEVTDTVEEIRVEMSAERIWCGEIEDHTFRPLDLDVPAVAVGDDVVPSMPRERSSRSKKASEARSLSVVCDEAAEVPSEHIEEVDIFVEDNPFVDEPVDLDDDPFIEDVDIFEDPVEPGRGEELRVCVGSAPVGTTQLAFLNGEFKHRVVGFDSSFIDDLRSWGKGAVDGEVFGRTVKALDGTVFSFCVGPRADRKIVREWLAGHRSSAA